MWDLFTESQAFFMSNPSPVVNPRKPVEMDCKGTSPCPLRILCSGVDNIGGVLTPRHCTHVQLMLSWVVTLRNLD
jgi:hypothetical protein